MVENDTQGILPDEEPSRGEPFLTHDRLEAVLGFFKLAGFNFLKTALLLATLFLMAYSFYRLFFHFGFGGEIMGLVMGRLKFSAVKGIEWGWLLAFVASWATLSALLGRRH